MTHKTIHMTKTRRRFLQTGGLTLSAGAVALLSGQEGLLTPANVRADTGKQDAAILNTALGAELQAIAAYQVGAESGLLTKPILDVAVGFQGHHKEHADLLRETVTTLGATPVEPQADYGFPLEQLKVEADVLRFAAGLEKGAVSAYLGAVPLFANRDLSKAAASILGDEAMHWAILRSVLGEDPVPVAFVE